MYNAVWLCSRFSHQCAGISSGSTTVTHRVAASVCRRISSQQRVAQVAEGGLDHHERDVDPALVPSLDDAGGLLAGR